MTQTKQTKTKRFFSYQKRLVLIALAFSLAFWLLLFWGKLSLALLLGFAVVILLLLFLSDKLWWLVIISPPSLVLGKVLYIPITESWIYEARLAEVFLLLAAAVFTLKSFFSSRSIKLDKISLLLFIYILISLLSLGWIIKWRLFVFGLKIIIFSWLAYFLSLNLLNSVKRLNWFLASLSLTAIILSLQIFYKFYQLGFSRKFFFARNTILIPIGPIATSAAILAFLSLLVLGFALSTDSRGLKLLASIAFALSFMAVFLTLGKGAILSLLAGLALFARSLPRKAPLFFFLWLFALIAMFVFTPFFIGLAERLKNTFVDVNTRFRILEYKTAWRLIPEHLWLGLGPGQQLYYYKKLLHLEQGQMVNNFYLQALLDAGLAGLFVVVLLSFEVWRLVRTKAKKIKSMPLLATAFAAGLACAFLNGLVEVTFFALPYAIIFFLSLGALPNILLLAKQGQTI